MSADGPFVRRTDGEGFARLWLDRPPVNVLTIAMMEELAKEIERAGTSPGVRAVQIRGAGRAFSAGVDIADHTDERVVAMMDAFLEMLRAIDACEVPIVAAVHGHCLGGGLELAASCDLVYAAASAALGQPEIKVGMIPPAAIAAFPSRIGVRATAELVFLGETISAARAKELGLVNDVFPDDELFERADAVCAKLGALSRPVLSLARRALRAAAPPVDPAALRMLRQVYFTELMQLEDAHEGLRAFQERRRPLFKDH